MADSKPNDDGTSSFQKRVKQLQKEIAVLEDAAVQPKHWVLMGEAGAAGRPQNSLLDVELAFDRPDKVAPVITEEVTRSLEDIIKHRIRDSQWDDVEPRKAPEITKGAKGDILDHTKSKKSLSQIYEEDFLKAQRAKAEAEAKSHAVSAQLHATDPNLVKKHDQHGDAHKALAELWSKLSHSLNALTSFHYIPKPVSEVEVKANVPALVMEEITPMVTSDAMLLAPQELYAPKGQKQQAAQSELTKSERHGKFRRKKARKTVARAKENQEKKLGIHNKERTLRQLRKAKNVTVMVDTKPFGKKHKQRDNE